MPKYTIKVRTVGQSFGCEGVVLCDGKEAAVTRVFPYGFHAAAYTAAETLIERLTAPPQWPTGCYA